MNEIALVVNGISWTVRFADWRASTGGGFQCQWWAARGSWWKFPKWPGAWFANGWVASLENTEAKEREIDRALGRLMQLLREAGDLTNDKKPFSEKLDPARRDVQRSIDTSPGSDPGGP